LDMHVGVYAAAEEMCVGARTDGGERLCRCIDGVQRLENALQNPGQSVDFGF